MFIDTHCHLHTKGYKLDPYQEIKHARNAGVTKLILVGEDIDDSQLALEMAQNQDEVFAAVGIHPHEAGSNDDVSQLKSMSKKLKVVAIGECGLDYWYNNSPTAKQKQILIEQINLAVKAKLPIIFHVRGSKANPADAFDDFFQVYDSYKKEHNHLRGVVHSFSSGQAQLEGVLSRGLYVGVNGIATFADADTQEVMSKVPLNRMLLETDAPFLTPKPNRGKVNAPKYLVHTAEYISKKRGLSIDELANATTTNATRLFNLEA